MTAAATCSVKALHIDGVVQPMLAYGRETTYRRWMPRRRCGDCGVRPGGWHHLGCDMQECPLCHQQMCSCGCRFDEDGDLDDEDDWDDLDDWTEEEDWDEAQIVGSDAGLSSVGRSAL